MSALFDEATWRGDDKDRGLYCKYSRIERSDGQSAPGGKHHGCQLFVLDLTHDQHAIPAILAYADSCEADGFTALAADLRAIVRELREGEA